MKLVLDTNAYCRCDVGDASALEALEDARQLFLPSIVYGELYFGFKHGNHFEKNLKRLDEFLDRFQVDVIPMDLDVAKKFGEIYSHLRKKRKPIPTNDIWISACCMEVGGTLLTADRHFESVDQIQVHYL